MMQIRLPKRQIAIAVAALMLTNAIQLGTVVAETTEAETATTTAAVTDTAEISESQAETSGLSSVTVIYSEEATNENYAPTDWWKAGLGEYQDSFSLVTYETVGGSQALIDLDGDGIPDEVPEEEREAILIAEGKKNDTIISNEPTASAVTSVSEGQFAFTTYGYGHGVGMSQNGANFYAKYAGWNYQDILFHYYPGTTLKNTGTAEKETVTVQGVPGNVLMQVAEIVNREVGPSMHVEAIKAQAVAVYTYIKYYHNDSHDLKGKKNPPQSLIDACASVLGEALYYNDQFAMTMFYASSGGITANCNDVFSADIPYLRSVASEFDAAYDPHYGDVIYFTVEELRRKLQGAYGITLSPNPENWITLVEGNGGYVNKVIIDGQVTVRGNAFRSVMGFKSPKFTYICAIGDTPMETVPETTPVIPQVTQPVVTPTQPSTTPTPTEAPTTPETQPATEAPTVEEQDPTEVPSSDAEPLSETE